MSTTVRPRRSNARRGGGRSRRQSGGGGSTRRRSARGRRSLVIWGTLLAVSLGAFLLIKSGFFQRTIEEFTLPLHHEDIIRQQAAEKGVPADLIAAVIYSESRFRDQTSHAGARGLMQITPATAKLIEKLSGGQTFRFEDLSDPDINIRYGTFYLRYLLDKFDDNEVAALAAYNAGETNVAEWGGSDLQLDDIPFPETRGYVENVLDKRKDYASHYRDELGLD
jgi:soluble lytic murein transglycosylase